MNPDKDKDEEIRQASHRKETTEREHEKNRKKITEGRRSVIGKPVDPNSLINKIQFPPGIEPEDAVDPGRATPSAPPVDNRSGKKE
jgi:hypothetical protein